MAFRSARQRRAVMAKLTAGSDRRASPGSSRTRSGLWPWGVGEKDGEDDSEVDGNDEEGEAVEVE